MDARIKLIVEDADSIARRDDMCYRKRPELLKLVEEFYRAYSSLAERYNGARGQLLQAHQTRDASHSQVSFLFADDAPSTSEQHTPFTRFPIHAFDREESATTLSKKGLKHQEEDQEGLAQLLNENQNLKTRILIEFKEVISNLMKDIAPAQKYTTELELHANMLNEQIGRAKNDVEAQSQEQQKAIALEMRNGFQMIKDLKMCKKDVKIERGWLGDENQNLNELVLHSSNGNSRRQNGQPNDKILQCWEIAEWGCHHDLMNIKIQEQSSLSTVDDILHHELDMGSKIACIPLQNHRKGKGW
ncbi:hypothetical protein Nepgr_022521 [Nepenthes gracilis]|uniref:NAB domain-containing protein n=1 Tax=Nepenthes gracilis TaxID=150966 RepID=A0AAD3T0X4_NEPGR|nr:hypothetical protein Nepgr_022521 [Nepenthes gracilis]